MRTCYVCGDVVCYCTILLMHGPGGSCIIGLLERSWKLESWGYSVVKVAWS